LTYGYQGRILRADLSLGRITIEEPDEDFYRAYVGGRGLVSFYLFKEVPRGADPLGPDNRLIFAGGPLSGISAPGVARTSVGAKSPLTGGYGDAEAGGHWGPKLARAGYDAIVIAGRAEQPVYLRVTDEAVEIRSAEDLWGLEIHETQEAIRAEIGDPELTAAMIGPASERRVRFACIGLGLHNYAGRSGLGAVMGAKNLKAVAVNGRLKPDVADPEEIKALAAWMARNCRSLAPLHSEWGTAGFVKLLDAAGGLPTRNFMAGSFDGAEAISGQNMARTIVRDRWGCYACPIRCKQVVEVEDEGLSVGRLYGGPEYETIGSFGSNLGIDDIRVVAKANEICDRNTLDTISTGMMIAGAMECAEKGLLPPELTVGLDLRFGSARGALDLLDRIVHRTGLGDVLAEGPKGVAEQLGPEAAACFLHVKGQPLPLHEPRWKAGMGVGFTLSPTGADHMHNIHDSVYASRDLPTFAPARSMGILEPLESTALGPAKARLWVYMTLARSLNNSLLTCFFTLYSLNQMAGLVRAATGWNTSSWELVKASERALNLARCFNAREGFTSADDLLPERFFEPARGGALDGRTLDRTDWLATRDLAYDMLGWDRHTAAPLPWKLYELGLDWVADELERGNPQDRDGGA